MDWTVVWWVLAALIILAGLVGTVLPALPGVPMIFVGLLLAAWSNDFVIIGWGTLSILAVLTVIAVLIDYLAAAFGAKRLGASPRAFWGATLGAIAGMFFGLPGIILGPFVGAVVAEFSGGQGARQAGRSGYGVWVGLVIGTAAKLSIAFLMLGIFMTKYLLG